MAALQILELNGECSSKSEDNAGLWSFFFQ